MKNKKNNAVDYANDAEIIKKNGPALLVNGNDKLEVNPCYFVGAMTNTSRLVYFYRVGWFEWTADNWKQVRKTVVKSRIRDLLREKVLEFSRSIKESISSNKEAHVTPAFELVNSKNINEIFRLLEIECEQGDSLPTLAPDVIPVLNGILRWNEEKKDIDFAPYTQDDLIFSRLNAEYVPEADQTFFLTKLAEIMPDAEDRRVIQEYMGAALFSENRTRKFAMFQGEGGCGKSFLVRLMTGILSKGRTFDIEFKSLKCDFAFSSLTTQTLLTASEAVSEAFCKSSGIEFVKKAVGGDFFETARKYENEKYGHNGFYSMIIVSNNDLRMKYDGRGDEFKDRLIPIIFNTHIENPDMTLVDTLLREHASAILNWLLEGARRVRANNWIIQLSADQIDRRDRIVEATRGIDLFVKTHIVESKGKNLRTSAAYELYNKLYKSARYEYLPEDAFRKRLSHAMAREYGATGSNSIPLPNGKTARGYRGFKLVTEVPANEKKTLTNNPSQVSPVTDNNERTDTND